MLFLFHFGSLSDAHQQFVQNAHSIIHHLWNISLPIWFDTEVPFSGSLYHKCILATKLIRVLLVLVVITIILKWILISLTQYKYQNLMAQTIFSKTYTAAVITELTSQPRLGGCQTITLAPFSKWRLLLLFTSNFRK